MSLGVKSGQKSHKSHSSYDLYFMFIKFGHSDQQMMGKKVSFIFHSFGIKRSQQKSSFDFF